MTAPCSIERTERLPGACCALPAPPDALDLSSAERRAIREELVKCLTWNAGELRSLVEGPASDARQCTWHANDTIDEATSLLAALRLLRVTEGSRRKRTIHDRNAIARIGVVVDNANELAMAECRPLNARLQAVGDRLGIWRTDDELDD
ncbi:hypothetical protein [Patulibacter medicamentivorans]|uniref:hypothetical protein n=1 Tax=Patulibacter medicamentivorans TaxID=1097667 RepID=UPI00058CC509|nr:hypothetical protein [Patulibacter medicamentivorans]